MDAGKRRIQTPSKSNTLENFHILVIPTTFFPLKCFSPLTSPFSSSVFLCFLLTSTQMDLQNLSMSPKPSLICIFFISFTSLVNYILSLDPKFQACVPCTCGDGPNISYPFWILHEQEPFCGNPNFTIICKDKNPVLTIANEDYII